MADCVLPEDMIICILLRLPVKSIIRFKSVCKQWHNLIYSPQFMQMHFEQFSGDTKSEDFIISGYTKSKHHTVSLFSINESRPRKLNLGDPSMRIVGCCKGLVCLYHKQSGEIYLWNPALNLSKHIRPSGVDFGASNWASLGFGYDDDVADFKVVKIVCQGGEYTRVAVAVEVYSAKSDSWQTVDVGFSFQVFSNTNKVIANGNPCWIARLPGGYFPSHLLWFDVKKLVFRIVPRLLRYPLVPYLVDWKGSLAAIGYSYRIGGVDSVEIWVFDESEIVWRLNHTFSPIGMKVRDSLKYSDNGKFIGNYIDGELIVFDFETACVEVIEIDGLHKVSEKIYGYNESLACVEGMEPVLVKEEEEKRGLRGRHPEDDEMAIAFLDKYDRICRLKFKAK